MSGWRFALKSQPALRVDLRGVTPAALSGMSAGDLERITVGHGNAFVPLAEFFGITPNDGDEALVFDGDLSRFDRVGWKMAGGSIRVTGPVGHYTGGCMSAGEMLVEGRAGLLAACEMAGGRLTVLGDVGDFAAGTLPGSLDGMRGGAFIVKGNAGARFGDRMRRGSAIVHGHAGDFLASRMAAGTIAVGGSVGAHVGYGMRRGSVVLASAPAGFEPAATFVPAIAAVDVIWQLLARDLARQGGPFATLASRRIERHLGDLSADGKGELIAAK
ncbi:MULTISPECIES: formylmethanofuran dehydrogenase subunit C [unclassified Variovorax]|uniref:formylmethanofuran dehydrogenase subunit C n=1 Tax=unclassified Variovorax TaxID=663243 RepID=UPI001BD21B73|nr:MULTISPECIES: formylmethanofuran dehydrogenase subunit C [unclassified Variovorax]